MQRALMRAAILCVMFAMVCVLSTSSRADSLIGLTGVNPDISIQAPNSPEVFLTYNISGSTGHLHVDGIPTTLYPNGYPGSSAQVINSGDFTLDAYLDLSNNDALSSTPTSSFTISGSLSAAPATTLLTGTLTAFGFYGDEGFLMFDVTFNVTGGTLQSAYGSTGYAIFSATPEEFHSTFDTSFSSALGDTGGGDVQALSAPAPSPAVLPAGLVLVSGVGLRRRFIRTRS